MIGRKLALAGLLGTAVGGPYLATQAPDDWAPDNWSSAWASPAAEAEAPPTTPSALQLTPPVAAPPAGPGSEVYQSPAPLVGTPGIGLEQALRWEIDRNWVYRHWARKSTGLADPTLFGVRVPLVTGSGMTDIAGSLTYYFDRDGLLQRMRLNGTTADTTRLVQLAATRFGLQPKRPDTPGEQLWQALERKRVRSELRTRPESVLWATQPHSSFRIRLELNRPGGERWVAAPELRFEPPAPTIADRAAPAQPDDGASGGRPVLPPRGLIPDAERVASAPASAGRTPVQSSAANPAAGPVAPVDPKPPTVGEPTAAPAPSVKPLDGYRERFRWPG